MAAAFTYVVIGVLVAHMAVLYLPFDKKKKMKYCTVILMVTCVGVLMLGALFGSGEKEKPHLPYNYREIIAKNPCAKQTLMAAYGMTEIELEAKQPFEEVTLGDLVQGFAVFAFSFCPLILLCGQEDDNEMKIVKTQKWVFAFCAVACAMLLSLLYGLKLTIVPIYKKAFRKAKPSPALS